MCRETKNARIYLAPPYAPSIYRVLLQDDGTFPCITDIITLKDREGRPLNGLPNPLAKCDFTEIPFDGRGKLSNRTSTASTPKRLVRLTDGTFWIADREWPLDRACERRWPHHHTLRAAGHRQGLRWRTL